jgi:hypothetical protein
MTGPNLFDELNRLYSPRRLEGRAEDAWAGAINVMNMIREHIEGEDDQKRLMSAWFKAVRDNDFKKFSRALKKYEKLRRG